MRKVNIILTIAFVAFLYACGGGKGTENTESADSTKAVETTDNQAATEVVEAKEPIDLYKYFTKEEIEQKMANALNKIKHQVEYDKLLKADGFLVSPKKIIEKWGEPTKKEEKEEQAQYEGKMKVVLFTYPQFILKLEAYQPYKEWLVSYIETDTPGFGFAGIYVGIKECNKEYVKKLLQHVDINEGTDEDGFDEIYSKLNSEMYTEFHVVFDKNGIVKSVSYFCANYAD